MNTILCHLFHSVTSVDKMSDINVIYRLSSTTNFFLVLFSRTVVLDKPFLLHEYMKF